ncbi:MAG: DUF433 domain-containing protein [Thermomicrobiales bacterium]
MAAPKTDPYPHIVRSPEILEGEPRVVGSRIAVRMIVQTARYSRDTAELYGAHPTITPEATEEALAYYETHWEEIDHFIEENEDALSATLASGSPDSRTA